MECSDINIITDGVLELEKMRTMKDSKEQKLITLEECVLKGSQEQKRYAAFLSRRESISGESPISFPEDTSMPYSGIETEPTRLQVEGHNHHSGWCG
ncbi:hypothetical protein TNCV_2209891 [Trichonephila clavipes]|nr:hypothetical protein TNCV_2209891 [Trichonephila clavipes]